MPDENAAADQETPRRHRRTDQASARAVHGRRGRAAAAHAGRRDPGRRRPRRRRPDRGRLDDHARRSWSPAWRRISLSTACRRRRVPPDVSERFSRIDHRGSYLQMHFALDGIPEFARTVRDAERSRDAVEHRAFQHPRRIAAAVGGLPPRHRARPIPPIALQIPSVHDPGLAPDGKHAASAFSLWFPITKAENSTTAELKAEMGQRVIDKLTRLAPNFEELIIRHTTFTPTHMGTMFGAPGGDYCHGLIHPDQIGPTARARGLSATSLSDRRTVPGQCGMPWRTGDHVHSRLQRGETGARGGYRVSVASRRSASSSVSSRLQNVNRTR